VNIGAVCDAATAAALQVDWLVKELQPVGTYGSERFQNWQPFSGGSEADARSHAERIGAIATSDSERLESIREALRDLPDIRAIISRAGLDETLGDADFLSVFRFCERTRALRTLVDETISSAPPEICDEVLEALSAGKSGEFAFYLGNSFSAQLANARAEFTAAESRFETLRSKRNERVAHQLGRAVIATDEFIIMRDELRGELPAGVHVIREAPTYWLCELELDEPALEALQERDRWAAAVAAAEEDVRRKLSRLIAQHAGILEQSATQAGELDVFVAAARFVQRHRCVVPEYRADASLAFEDARFLPLEDELSRSSQSYVPISLALERSNVLTGPNMGGKSAALRTTGFIAVCAGFGLPVPAKNVSAGLFDRVQWLGIHGGDRVDENGELLSSFAREVVRLRDMLRGQCRALWLVDEFARTTMPDEARALLLALLGRLKTRDGCTLAATHLMVVDAAAETAHFAVAGFRGDGSVPGFTSTEDALSTLNRRIDYRIERVHEAPQPASDALQLARWLGLDKELVESAKEILARCSP